MSNTEQFLLETQGQEGKIFVDGCVKGQQFTHYNQGELMYLEMLKIPERGSELLATDFMVGLSRTKIRFEAVTTWVYKLSKIVHFRKSKTKDASIEVAGTFFKKHLEHPGL